MEPKRLEAWQAFMAAHRAVVKELAHELEAETGLPLAWYEVLLYLQRAPDQRLRMQELADSVVLTPSGLTRLVDHMEAAGLVRREACPTDRRGSYAVLAKKGYKRLSDTAPVHLRGVEEHFASHLTDHEAAVLSKALGKVLAALRR
jgi:DNA-binding MarR family transcriptional regulator